VGRLCMENKTSVTTELRKKGEPERYPPDCSQ